MIVDLLRSLFDYAALDSLSFRAAMAAFTAFALAVLLGAPVIRWLRNHRVGENTDKTDAPELA
ncbi:MAG: hypothetical protein ACJA0P_000981, partial [Planctomycetota bacterium]